MYLRQMSVLLFSIPSTLISMYCEFAIRGNDDYLYIMLKVSEVFGVLNQAYALSRIDSFEVLGGSLHFKPEAKKSFWIWSTRIVWCLVYACQIYFNMYIQVNFGTWLHT